LKSHNFVCNPSGGGLLQVLRFDFYRMKKFYILIGILPILLTCCLPARRTVTLALLGDLMVGRDVHPGPASLSYLAPQLKSADLSLANLESPLAPKAVTAVPPGVGYDLCATSVRADLFPVWGLDMLSLANNHRFDCGPAGVTATVQALTALGLTPLLPASEPVYRQINGLNLAFLAFDDILQPVDTAAALRSIQSARSTGALVVVSVHWGMEYQSGASARQKTLAGQFAAAGAVLVVGTHPHVLQPAEWIATVQGKTLVLYSLGNALFDQPGLPDTRQSALVLVTFDSHGVQSSRAIPYVIDVSASNIIAPDAHTASQIHARLALP
jgi:poly-gamma-glutamate capsule biosynthesis protein CapA/YwtB (metallophosphatase superfamily)